MRLESAELKASLRLATNSVPLGSRWSHKKGDAVYTVRYVALLQVEGDRDMEPCIVYEADGVAWARPSSAFLSRFTRKD